MSQTIYISKPADDDFLQVVHYVKQFELDDRDMHPGQFLIAKNNTGLLGFGRIRVHKGCDEFCTLGVIENKRSTGIGELLIKAIITASSQPLYLACIIPGYFIPFGFKVVNEFPGEMQDKLDYCNAALAVPETYVVMKYVA